MFSDPARQLGNDLDRASDEFMELQLMAAELIRQAPSGIPYPYGVHRVEQASRRLTAAFHRYQQAAKRYRDYVDHGMVPPRSDPPQ